jgi:hypothetical protein
MNTQHALIAAAMIALTGATVARRKPSRVNVNQQSATAITFSGGNRHTKSKACRSAA